MATLYFIRHAESEANARGAYAGHTPVSLTAKGRTEASHTARAFCSNHTISKIYASPLLRAQQTASFFSEKVGVSVTPNELLQEQDMGDYSGLEYAVAEKLPTFEPVVGNRWKWRPPNGESYEQVASRTVAFLKQIENEKADEKILVVTHGVFLRLMRGALENTLPVFFTGLTKNCEIWKTEFIRVSQKHSIESIYFGEPDSKTHRE